MRISVGVVAVQLNPSASTVQELLGHGDVSTAMPCTHVLIEGGLGVRSPLGLGAPRWLPRLMPRDLPSCVRFQVRFQVRLHALFGAV